MQSSRLKRYRHLVGRFDGLLTRTPVITYGLAIPFAVMGTVDARAAFALSIGMMAISLLSTAVGWVLKRMGQGREVYMLVTAVLSSLTLAGLSRLPLGGFQMPVGMLGIYFPLLAVNTLTFFLVTRCDEQKSLPANLAQAARSVLSFAFFVMAVSLFRELLGKGSIFGVKVLGSLQISTVLMPFFGFILVGMLSAFCRQVNRSIRAWCLIKDREEAMDAKTEEVKA